MAVLGKISKIRLGLLGVLGAGILGISSGCITPDGKPSLAYAFEVLADDAAEEGNYESAAEMRRASGYLRESERFTAQQREMEKNRQALIEAGKQSRSEVNVNNHGCSDRQASRSSGNPELDEYRRMIKAKYDNNMPLVFACNETISEKGGHIFDSFYNINKNFEVGDKVSYAVLLPSEDYRGKNILLRQTIIFEDGKRDYKEESISMSRTSTGYISQGFMPILRDMPGKYKLEVLADGKLIGDTSYRVWRKEDKQLIESLVKSRKNTRKR